MVTDVRDLQLANALSPIVVTELGMVTDVKGHPTNIPLLIVVTELGMVTDVRDLQLANAWSPIVVTELEMVTDVREGHP